MIRGRERRKETRRNSGNPPELQRVHKFITSKRVVKNVMLCYDWQSERKFHIGDAGVFPYGKEEEYDMKKLILLAAMGIMLSLSGCSQKEAAKETEAETQYAEGTYKIQIYSAADSSLLATVEDEATIEKLLETEAWEQVEDADTSLEPEYGIVIWKEKKINYTPAENAEPEEEYEIIETYTTYKDSKLVLKEYTDNAVKGIKLPITSLQYCYNASDEFFETLQAVLQ